MPSSVSHICGIGTETFTMLDEMNQSQMYLHNHSELFHCNEM